MLANSSTCLSSQTNNLETAVDTCKIPSHIHVLNENGAISYTCNVCKRTFTAKNSIAYHYYCNGHKKPFDCNECGKSFVLLGQFKVHELKHRGEKPFSCSVCDKKFYEKGKLNRHLKLHSGEKPHTCDECDKKFSNKDTLIVHKRVHSGERPYHCNECKKTFANVSNLLKHMKVHEENSETIICELCGRNFKQKVLYNQHYRRIHAIKEKKFKCLICEKVFCELPDFKRHQLIHKTEKEFECDVCSTRFRRKDNLIRHKRSFHENVTNSQQKYSQTVTTAVTAEKKQTNSTVTATATATSTTTAVILKVPVTNPINKNSINKKVKRKTIQKSKKVENNVDILRLNMSMSQEPLDLKYRNIPKIGIGIKPYNENESKKICQKIFEGYSQSGNKLPAPPPVPPLVLAPPSTKLRGEPQLVVPKLKLKPKLNPKLKLKPQLLDSSSESIIDLSIMNICNRNNTNP